MGFGVGNVFAATFRIWFRNLPRFLLLTVICWLPIVAFDFLLVNDAVMAFMNRHIYGPLMEVHPEAIEAAFGSWLPLSVLVAAIAMCTVGQLRDEPLSIWRGLAIALRRLPWIIAVALVVRLATWGVVMVITILRSDPQDFTRERMIEDVLSDLLWIVLLSLFVATIPAAVVERRGVLATLGRAFVLARGQRIRVFAIKLAHHVLLVALYMGSNHLLLASSDSMAQYGERFRILAYVRLGMNVVLASLAAVLAAVVYERLRESKEGATPGQLQNVFD